MGFTTTVYPKKCAHGFVVLCFIVVMQSFIMNPHEIFIHIHQGCFAGTGAIVRLPQCQWSKPDGYGKISQCITTTKHSIAKTVCIFLGIYCIWYTLNNYISSAVIRIHLMFHIKRPNLHINWFPLMNTIYPQSARICFVILLVFGIKVSDRQNCYEMIDNQAWMCLKK